MTRYQPNVVVHWSYLGDEDDPDWQASRCLYGYLHPRKKEILYIGKSWGTTVRGRWRRTAKEQFWNDLEVDRRIFEHAPVLGMLSLAAGRRLSHELLMDVESLLIRGVQPWGNIQCRETRIPRPGLVVKCTGTWPGRHDVYVDAG